MAIKEFLTSIGDSISASPSEAENGQASPLNTLSSTPNKLIYPLNDQERYGASITFKVFEVVPPTLKGDSSTVSEMLGEEGDARYKELNEQSKGLERQFANKQITRRVYRDKKARIKNSMDARYVEKHGTKSPMEYTDRNIEDTGNMVKLYLPIALTQADGLSYAQPERGPYGAGATAAMSQGKGILETLGAGFEKGMTNIADMVAGNLQGAAAGLALQRTAAAMNGTAGNAASLAFGVTVNPNARTVFKGVNIREFAFQFKFIPKSSLEAKEVEKIIKRFRSYAYPDTINIAGVNAGYKYPHMFELDLFYENEAGVKKRVGTKMKKCHLKAISTNYNSSSMAFHPDGYPVEIDLSLSFVEERTLNRSDIMDEDGF